MWKQRTTLKHRVYRAFVGRQMGDILSPSKICPDVGVSTPAISRKSVVFPQPEGPSRVKNSPCRICPETSSNALTATAPCPKALTALRASTAIGMVFKLGSLWIMHLA